MGTDDEEFVGPTSEETEQEAWLTLMRLDREWTTACRQGNGTAGLREAAEALRDVQRILERERGRRQLLDSWYERASDE